MQFWKSLIKDPIILGIKDVIMTVFKGLNNWILQNKSKSAWLQIVASHNFQKFATTAINILQVSRFQQGEIENRSMA